MYDLKNNDHKLVFEEKVGGGEDQYIKLKEVEQNEDGNRFALVYYDHGKFRRRTFGLDSRSEDEIKRNEVEFNSIIGIEDNTMAITGFPDPFINCCFIHDEKLYIALMNTETCIHYHFFWDIQL